MLTSLPASQTRAAVVLLGIWLCAAAFAADESPATAAAARLEALRPALLAAISTNGLATVCTLLREEPALAKATNESGMPLLVLAAERQQVEIVATLLQAGAPPDAQRAAQHQTALDIAFIPWDGPSSSAITSLSSSNPEPRLAIALLLLRHGANPFNPLASGGSLAHRAASYGRADTVDFLLTNTPAVAPRDAAGNSALHLAALWGRTNALRVLLAQGARLDAVNDDGLTPFQSLARVRLRKGGYFWGGWQSLAVSAAQHRDDLAELLLASGARLDLFSSVALGWTNMTAKLLATNASLAVTPGPGGQSALHWAAEFGELEAARLLLAAGAPVDALDSRAQTPLDVAAASGAVPVASLLVEHGASVRRPPGRWAPIHSAAQQGNGPLLELLLTAGADVNAGETNRRSPLDLAAEHDREPAVRLLLDRQATLTLGGTNVTTPLHWAVAHGNSNLVAELLRRGCDARARNANGQPPLHLAHVRNDFALLEFLLRHGASIRDTDAAGSTVLHVRASAAADRFPAPPGSLRKQWDKVLAHPRLGPLVPKSLKPGPPTRSMMEFLLRRGAPVNATNLAGKTPLHGVTAKAFQGTNAVVEAAAWMRPLLRGGSRVNASDTNGCTPLHLAVTARNAVVAEALLNRGANSEAVDRDGRAALHLALTAVGPSAEGLPTVELLLQRGARVNLADRSGATPLHTVFTLEQRDHIVALAWLLLKHGAAVNAVDRSGATPLHFASGKGVRPYAKGLSRIWMTLPFDTEEVDAWYGTWEGSKEDEWPALLLAAGARVNARDALGNTPLHEAARAARPQTVVRLLEHGADRTARNVAGQTPFQLAREQPGGFELMPLLQPPGRTSDIADAAQRGDLPGVEAWLRELPADANLRWFNGTTPLQWACNGGHLEVAELLLRHGARTDPPPQRRTEHSRKLELTLFKHWSQIHTNRGATVIPDTVRRRAWAMPASQTNWHNFLPPLELALAGGHREVADLLVRHGARVDLYSAATLGDPVLLARALLARPGELNALGSWNGWVFAETGGGWSWGGRDLVGGTPLHFAVRAGQWEAVLLLLRAGTDVSAVDPAGWTAADWAAWTGQPALAQWLHRRASSLPSLVAPAIK